MNSNNDWLLSGPGGSYQLTQELGRGSFGVSYLAYRLEDNVEVVVKVLNIENIPDERFFKTIELFGREAKTLRSLEHPQIPRYIDDFPLGDPEWPSGYALVQTRALGRTLEELRGSGHSLSKEKMWRWFHGLLQICRYLHNLQPPVIHRDISPNNIILQDDGTPVLIDFGTVQAPGSSSSTVTGTVGYAPMEQFVGRAQPSSDLYALAVTYVAMATGLAPEELPFEGNRLNVRAAWKAAYVSVDPAITAVLERMLEPDATKRNVTAEQLLTRLENRPPPPQVRKPPPEHLKRTKAAPQTAKPRATPQSAEVERVVARQATTPSSNVKLKRVSSAHVPRGRRETSVLFGFLHALSVFALLWMALGITEHWLAGLIALVLCCILGWRNVDLIAAKSKDNSTLGHLFNLHWERPHRSERQGYWTMFGPFRVTPHQAGEVLIEPTTLPVSVWWRRVLFVIAALIISVFAGWRARFDFIPTKAP